MKKKNKIFNMKINNVTIEDGKNIKCVEKTCRLMKN